MKKRKYTWKEFDKDIKVLAKKLKKYKFHAVYGIPRGGLILAVRLSHLLNIPITLDPYNADLVVDEICDNGRTIKRMSQLPCFFKGRKFVVIHLRIKRVEYLEIYVYRGEIKESIGNVDLIPSPIIPDIYLYKLKDWIIYPWEK
jgi:hypoxanthine phosphoribosyltransferase